MLTLDLLMKTGQLSQYNNYDFNSMVEVGGKYYGTNGNGLFILDGDDDDGTPIDAFIELATTNLGINARKRLRAVDIGYESDGDLEVSILFDKNISREQTRTFSSTEGGQVTERKTATRKNSGSYVRLRIDNVEGSDFSLDNIDVTPIVLHSARSRKGV